MPVIFGFFFNIEFKGQSYRHQSLLGSTASQMPLIYKCKCISDATPAADRLERWRWSHNRPDSGRRRPADVACTNATFLFTGGIAGRAGPVARHGRQPAAAADDARPQRAEPDKGCAPEYAFQPAGPGRSAYSRGSTSTTAAAADDDGGPGHAARLHYSTAVATATTTAAAAYAAAATAADAGHAAAQCAPQRHQLAATSARGNDWRQACRHAGRRGGGTKVCGASGARRNARPGSRHAAAEVRPSINLNNARSLCR